MPIDPTRARARQGPVRAVPTRARAVDPRVVTWNSLVEQVSKRVEALRRVAAVPRRRTGHDARRGPMREPRETDVPRPVVRSGDHAGRHGARARPRSGISGD